MQPAELQRSCQSCWEALQEELALQEVALEGRGNLHWEGVWNILKLPEGHGARREDKEELEASKVTYGIPGC